MTYAEFIGKITGLVLGENRAVIEARFSL